MKNKYAQSKTDAFSQTVKSSKLKLTLLGTDDGKEYVNEIFNEYLNNHNIKRNSRYTILGAVFAEKNKRTKRNLLNKPISPTGNADWLSELPSIITKFNKTIHNSTKRAPIQASIKSNEKEVYSNLQHRRDKQTPKIIFGDLIRISSFRKVFGKGDSTNYSYNLYTETEVIFDTIPSYRIDFSPDRHNENLLLHTNLTL